MRRTLTDYKHSSSTLNIPRWIGTCHDTSRAPINITPTRACTAFNVQRVLTIVSWCAFTIGWSLPSPVLAGSPHTYAALLASAEKGDAVVQTNIGMAYFMGEANGHTVMPKDNAVAVNWWRKAAAQDEAEAELMLAQAYHYGLGVPKDDFQAVKWWSKAAAKQCIGEERADIALAKSHVGSMYHEGLGVPKNDSQAVKWWGQAADNACDDNAAQNDLGLAYDYGWGVAKDDIEAVRWWKQFTYVFGSNTGAMMRQLGEMYRLAEPSLPQDHVLAYMWFTLAEQDGEPAKQPRMNWPS